MGKRLENKNIVVTAAGQGIGRATAIAFSNEGANVYATDINEKTLKSLNKEHQNIKVKKLDSTDKSAVEEFSDSLDKIDVLFNAVGFVHHGSILECDEKDWDFSFNVNIKSMYFMIKSLIPKMIKQKKGNIINMSSIHGLVASPYKSAYVSAKHGIVGLTKAVALEVGTYGITVNAICPGYSDTPLVRNQLAEQARIHGVSERDALQNIMLEPAAIPELIKPEEMASIAGSLTIASIDGNVFASPTSRLCASVTADSACSMDGLHTPRISASRTPTSDWIWNLAMNPLPMRPMPKRGKDMVTIC